MPNRPSRSHSRQCWLAESSRFPGPNDLDPLAERLEADGAQIPVDRDRLNELTAYAGPLRYEELLDPEPLDRDAVNALADEVYRWADTELSG
jgi:hypothetical protein